MLEIKNLTKIYKSKKADPVKALDNVSLTFNNTGLVFLLGKSGSGKSTLLNVLGGLDKFDSGEIIIDGKSSKDFKEKDFDSYRNTYLGFIFQEYNILSEFTVYKNIEFALELQGKKPNRTEINNLLEQVDLVGYGKRKPNELSGGQKQRIAIARALIKNPQIIMADEPTGALDSNTGKQVFDTLKKLSKEKLVIVVSHDREFAEIYADRIIELKDGKVISDTTKRLREPNKLNEGFNIVDPNVIHIEKGHKYTKEEIAKLNEFLQKAEGDIILTSDAKLNKDVKNLAKIDDKGNREYFDKTAETDIEKDSKNKGLPFIKSRLKFKDSFKMGASGLKTKKVRLFFTILLSAVALTLFGLADTMASFNVKKSNYDSIMKIGDKQLTINLRHVNGDDDYYYGVESKVGDGDLADLKKQFPDYTFKPIVAREINLNNVVSGELYSYNHYPSETKGITSLTEEEMQKFEYKFLDEGSGITQHLPQADNEVVISSYHYKILKEFGLNERNPQNGNETKIEINNISDILNREIYFDYTTKFKVVGILDTRFDESKYEKLNELNAGGGNNFNFYALASEYRTKVNNGLGNVLIFTENKVNSILAEDERDVESCYEPSYTIGDVTYSSGKSGAYSVSGQKKVLKGDVIFFDSNKTTLENNEIIIGSGTQIGDGTIDFNISVNQGSEYINGDYEYYNYFIFNTNIYDGRIDGIDGVSYDFEKAKSDLEAGIREYYNSKIAENTDALKVRFYTNYDEEDTSISNYKVVGICFEVDGSYINNNYGLYFKNSESAPKKIRYVFNEYSSIITMLSGDTSKDKELIMALSDYGSREDALVIRSEVSSVLEDFLSMIKTMSKVFLYVGIGFAVFSALLLMNFIGISISYKKKEIGILRALGARGSDVYGIFLNESLIITFINFLVAIVLTIGGAILINSLVTSGLGIRLTLLSFGIRQVALLFAVSLVVALIASFLPTHRVSKMKPIDAILDRKTK